MSTTLKVLKYTTNKILDCFCWIGFSFGITIIGNIAIFALLSQFNQFDLVFSAFDISASLNKIQEIK
jgi:hypothetical protein